MLNSVAQQTVALPEPITRSCSSDSKMMFTCMYDRIDVSLLAMGGLVAVVPVLMLMLVLLALVVALVRGSGGGSGILDVVVATIQ